MKRLTLVLLVLLFVVQVRAQPPLRIGIIGDSSSDEYRGTDNRGGAYASVTFNWLELLVRYRAVDAGVWGSYSEPRRVGYANNWSRTAATTATMLSTGQHTGLAAQVDAGAIDAVIVWIGSNDFAPYNGNYLSIYNGTIAGAALDAKIAALVDRVTLALNTVRRTRPVPVVIVTIGDWNNSPLILNNSAYSDPTKRARVTAAIQSTNQHLRLLAAQNGAAVFDTDAFTAALLPRVVNGYLAVGSEQIRLFGVGDEPHNGLLGDSIHAGTIMNGLLANEVIAALNTVSPYPLLPFSDSELLQAAGLAAPTPTNLPPTATWYAPPTLTPSLTPSPMPQPTATNMPPPTDVPTPTATLAWTNLMALPVRSGADDVNEDGSTFTASSPAVWLGNGGGTSWTGWRFTGVTIPAGVTIVSAHVDVYVPADVWIAMSFQMAGEAADNSAAFSASSRPSQRALTAARVNHTSSVKWAANNWYSLNDITPIVQEILARPGWTGGNALSIIVRGTGSAWGRKYVRAYESGWQTAARLVITYR